MAIIARFTFDVPFGKKPQVLELRKKFEAVSMELGFPKGQTLVGSIGAAESTVETNYQFDTIAQLEEAWTKISDPRVGEFVSQMAQYVVPGSHRWQIFRIQD